jgi:hypothetical protein
MKKFFIIFTLLGCILCLYGNAEAAVVKISDTAFLDIHGFMQTRLYMRTDPGPGLKTDFYLRRVRLIFSGTIAPNFNFFIGTLNADMGKDGNMTSRTLIADAWMEFALSDAFKINAGLLKLPFSRHMQQSAGKLHGVDFHGTFLKRAGGTTHRDMGIMARGLLSDNRIDYRFAIVDGQEFPPGTHRNNSLRIVGRIGYNVFDPEPEYFWAGTYLGKKKVLSFGASFDLEPGAGGKSGEDLYSAFSLDAFADVPVGENHIVSTLNIYSYGEGGIIRKGVGLWADFGYRIDKIEPIIEFEWYEPSEGNLGKRLAFMGGLNWWIQGYNVNIKFQVGTQSLNGSNNWTQTAILQGQLLF